MFSKQEKRKELEKELQSRAEVRGEMHAERDNEGKEKHPERGRAEAAGEVRVNSSNSIAFSYR